MNKCPKCKKPTVAFKGEDCWVCKDKKRVAGMTVRKKAWAELSARISALEFQNQIYRRGLEKIGTRWSKKTLSSAAALVLVEVE